jgi:6-phosphogluconolactonase (cycloisomerase 2 family)
MKKSTLVFILSVLIITAQAQVNYVNNVYAKSASQSAVSHNGKFLFLSSFHEIIVFEINPSTGALTKKRTLPSPTNSEFCGMHLSPDDNFLYTQSRSRPGASTTSISTYACNPLTGELKLKHTLDQQGTETFELMSMTNMSPQGNFLFVANNSYKDLFVYRRNVTDGSLNFQNKISSGKLMMFFEYVISPDDKFMYVNCANIYKEATIYSIDPNTGYLAKVTEVTNPIYPNSYAHKMLVSPDGKNIYTINQLYQDATQDYRYDLTQYSRDEQSGLMSYQVHYPNLKAQGVGQLDYLFIDGSGEYVYASKAFGSDMHAFHIFKRDASTGNLTKLQSFFDSGTTNKLEGSYICSFTRDNQFLYVSAIDDHALNIFKNPNAKASVSASSVSVSTNTQGTDNPVLTGTTTMTTTSEGSTNNGGTISQPAGPVIGFPKDKFNEVRKELEAEASDTRRLDLCYKLLEGKALSTVQVASIAMLFESEYQRLEYVKFEYYFVNDREHYKLLSDLFTYDSILQEFNKLVR